MFRNMFYVSVILLSCTVIDCSLPSSEIYRWLNNSKLGVGNSVVVAASRRLRSHVILPQNETFAGKHGHAPDESYVVSNEQQARDESYFSSMMRKNDSLVEESQQVGVAVSSSIFTEAEVAKFNNFSLSEMLEKKRLKRTK